MEDLKKRIQTISSDVLNGVNYSRNEYARSILNYPAMMVPAVQEPIIEALSHFCSEEASLLDPFMGASNTLVTGMRFGLNLYGQDINPLSILLSQVKTTFYTPAELSDAETRINRFIESDLSNNIDIEFININKWFTKEVQIELSKISRAIKKEENLHLRKFFWIALAETIRLTSNDRTSTFKMHIRTLDEIRSRQVSAIRTFNSTTKKNIKNICDHITILINNGQIQDGKYLKDINIVWGDTNKEIKTDRRFDLLVTSPPYGDNHTTVTYGQFSYLPLQWIPLSDIDCNISFDYLKTAQTIDRESLGGKNSEKINDLEDRIFGKSETLKTFINQFNHEERIKANKVTRFISDLDSCIDLILQKMKKNSFLVWTIGNRSVNKQIVMNDLILRELFVSKGIELFTDLERDILSKRMPGRNNFSDTMSKEKILIFKKLY